MSVLSKNVFHLLDDQEEDNFEQEPEPVKVVVKEVKEKPKPKTDRAVKTDKTDSNKKLTVGKGNWGEPVQSQLEPDVIVAVEEEIPVVVEEEPEVIQKTLEQYMQERALKSVNAQVPKPRRANEGADDSQWKDAVVFTKTTEDFLVLGKTKSVKSAAKPKEKPINVDIQQTFKEEPRSERGDRGRGRGRGRGGSRGQRGGRGVGGNVTVNVEDQVLFPVLGK